MHDGARHRGVWGDLRRPGGNRELFVPLATLPLTWGGVRLLSIVVSLSALLSSASARAQEVDPVAEAEAEAAASDALLAKYFPAPVDGPELRLPISPTRP